MFLFLPSRSLDNKVVHFLLPGCLAGLPLTLNISTAPHPQAWGLCSHPRLSLESFPGMFASFPEIPGSHLHLCLPLETSFSRFFQGRRAVDLWPLRTSPFVLLVKGAAAQCVHVCVCARARCFFNPLHVESHPLLARVVPETQSVG